MSSDSETGDVYDPEGVEMPAGRSNHYFSVYLGDIAAAQSPNHLKDTIFNIKDAGADGLIDEGMMDQLLTACEARNVELSRVEFGHAARALCPGGPGACTLGINVTLPENGGGSACIRTCRATCMANVRRIWAGAEGTFTDEEGRKRSRVQEAAAGSGIKGVEIGSFHE